jgi:hypothetical protein
MDARHEEETRAAWTLVERLHALGLDVTIIYPHQGQVTVAVTVPTIGSFSGEASTLLQALSAASEKATAAFLDKA